MKARVVYLHCPGAGRTGQGLVGSGYRVDRTHVLTARHVLGAPEPDFDPDLEQDSVAKAPAAVLGCARVWLLGETEPRQAEVVWDGGPGLDLALLRLPDDAPECAGPGVAADPEWTACARVDLECVAWGYPTHLNFDGQPEREEFRGRLLPGAGVELRELHAEGRWTSPSLEGWSGMSGAALLCQGRLVGVVTDAAVGRLVAVPVSRLFDPGPCPADFGGFTYHPHRLFPADDLPALALLEAPKPRLLDPQGRPPSELLLAQNQVVDFDRELRPEAVARLEAFVNDLEQPDAPTVSVLLITGPGGAGKTRLLLEQCQYQRAQGWIAGFVDLRRARETQADLGALARGQTPRLLVVDYPKGHLDAVARLCRHLLHPAMGAPPSPVARLVLLERDTGPWWTQLRREIDSDILNQSTDPLQLGDLPPAQRLHTFERARRAFAQVTPPRETSAPTDAQLRGDIAPLYVHMRALLRDLLDSGQGSIVEAPEDVLSRVLFHERRHWKSQLHALPGDPAVEPDDVQRFLAVITLLGGVSTADLRPLLSTLFDPPLPRAQQDTLIRMATRLYGRGDRIATLQPDLLGEQLVYEAITAEVDLDGSRATERWLAYPLTPNTPQGAIASTLTVFTRLCQRQVDAARPWLTALMHAHGRAWIRAAHSSPKRDTLDPRGHELLAALQALDSPELAEHLDHELPFETIELAEFNVELMSQRVRALRAEPHRLDFSQLSRALNNLGNHLGNLGQPKDALDVLQEAVDIRRVLAKATPNAFLPDLAESLNNLGRALSELKNREPALDATQEAVDIRRELAKARPDVFLNNLAINLNNLGRALSELKKREAAFEATQEAVDIHRELAKARPDVFLNNLAMSLNNLSAAQGELGEREAALETTREAVDIHRELAKATPDVFLPRLALSLNNLGVALGGLGKQEAALDATQEARREVFDAARFMDWLSRADYRVEIVPLDGGEPKVVSDSVVELIEDWNSWEGARNSIGARLARGEAVAV